MNEIRGAWLLKSVVAWALALAVGGSELMGGAVNYKAPRTLARFMRSDAFIRAVVGPIASGKSSACVMELFRRAHRQAPDKDGVRRTRFAVIRNTRPQLQDTTRETFDQWLEGLGKWNEQKLNFRLRTTLADGTKVDSLIMFRALDKPKDVRKVLSLELTGAYVNEAREIPKEVFDGLTGRVGRFPAQKDGGCTWYGVWLDTNPWSTDSWGHKLFGKERPAGFELYEQPDALGPKGENIEHLTPGYYERVMLGKDSAWVDEYVRGKYPSADKGSVYGELLASLEAAGQVGKNFQHPSDGVHAVFDLGVSDATAIWWFRINGYGMPDLIDWHEETGKGMSHYFKVLDERGWDLQKIWLPHDARNRTWQTGASTIEQFAKRYGAGKVSIAPELGLQDGISAARWLLEQKVRFHERTKLGVERLRQYRYVWDERRKVYSRDPMHDFASHSSDCFRYVACVANASARMGPPPAPKGDKPSARTPNSFNLDELWSTAPNGKGGRV